MILLNTTSYAFYVVGQMQHVFFKVVTLKESRNWRRKARIPPNTSTLTDAKRIKLDHVVNPRKNWLNKGIIHAPKCSLWSDFVGPSWNKCILTTWGLACLLLGHCTRLLNAFAREEKSELFNLRNHKKKMMMIREEEQDSVKKQGKREKKSLCFYWTF